MHGLGNVVEDSRQLFIAVYFYFGMDKSVDFGESCDASILLKSKKEHYEKEVEKLISYIGEEYRANDPLSIIGKRFREKQEEFSNLRRENQELLLRTKNLAQDIQKLRASRDSNIPWEDLHISLERTQKVETMLASKEDTAFSDRIRSALGELDSQLEQVRDDNDEKEKEYDRILEWAITYLTRDKAAWSLSTEVQQARQEGSSGEDMVLVPRKRYNQLIEIYSINIAEISVNQLRQKMQKSLPAELEQRGVNYVEEARRVYLQKYADIAKGEDIDVKDLHQLFQALAKKVGFQNQWRRYHMQSTNAAVAFKARLDSLFTLNQSTQDPSDQQPADNFQFGQLMHKINWLIKELPFSQTEKEDWYQLSPKIKEDRLISIDTLTHHYRQMLNKETEVLMSKASALLHAAVAQSLQQFSKIVKTKLKLREVSWGKELKELTAESVLQAVSGKTVSDCDVWPALHEVAQEKITEIYEQVGRNFVSLSGAALYRASAGRK